MATENTDGLPSLEDRWKLYHLILEVVEERIKRVQKTQSQWQMMRSKRMIYFLYDDDNNNNNNNNQDETTSRSYYRYESMAMVSSCLLLSLSNPMKKDGNSLKEPLECVTMLLTNTVLLTKDGNYDARLRSVLKEACVKLFVKQNVYTTEDDEYPGIYLAKRDGESEGCYDRGVLLHGPPRDAWFHATKLYEKTERDVANGVMWQAMQKRMQQPSTKTEGSLLLRSVKIGSVGLVVGSLFAVTGGLAAPGLVAAVTAFGVGTGSAAFATLTTTSTLMALFGVTGGGMAAYKMKKRTDQVTQWKLEKKHNNTCSLYTNVCVSGWLHDDKKDFSRPWGIDPMPKKKLSKSDVLEAMQRYFVVHSPEKLRFTKTLLQLYKKRKEELYQALEMRYRVHPLDLLPFRKQTVTTISPRVLVSIHECQPVLLTLHQNNAMLMKMEQQNERFLVPNDQTNNEPNESSVPSETSKKENNMTEMTSVVDGIGKTKSLDETITITVSNAEATNEPQDEPDDRVDESNVPASKEENNMNETTSVVDETESLDAALTDAQRVVGDDGSEASTDDTLLVRVESSATESSDETTTASVPDKDLEELLARMEAMNAQVTSVDDDLEKLLAKMEAMNAQVFQEFDNNNDDDVDTLLAKMEAMNAQVIASCATNVPNEAVEEPRKWDHDMIVWDWEAMHGGELYTLTWETDLLYKLCRVVNLLFVEIGSQVSKELAKQTLIGGVVAAVSIPSALMTASNVIDDPYQMISFRSDYAGIELAKCLLQSDEHRPVTLVGYSFGARVVFRCVLELAKHQAIWEQQQQQQEPPSPKNKSKKRRRMFGSKSSGENNLSTYKREPASIVEDIVMIGMPRLLEVKEWLTCREMVAGRVVNCYSKSDWFLSYLFQIRCMAGVSRKTAGTHPVSGVDGVENHDVTEFVSTHGRYPVVTPLILQKVGLGQPGNHNIHLY